MNQCTAKPHFHSTEKLSPVVNNYTTKLLPGKKKPNNKKPKINSLFEPASYNPFVSHVTCKPYNQSLWSRIKMFYPTRQV
jgi:hypothetical protein